VKGVIGWWCLFGNFISESSAVSRVGGGVVVNDDVGQNLDSAVDEVHFFRHAFFSDTLKAGRPLWLPATITRHSIYQSHHIQYYISMMAMCQKRIRSFHRHGWWHMWRGTNMKTHVGEKNED